MKPVSWITQKVTSGYNSHPSSSGPTMSSIQSNFMASNSLPTNSKNEDPNPDHDPFWLSLGKRVLHGTTNKSKHSAVLRKGTDSIESMPYVGSEFREPNSNDRIFSSSRYNHPQNHVCSIRSSPIHFRSIRSSPIHFRSPLCGHEEECFPHTINETSNQSFETYQTERIHREKVSERRGQIRSSTKTWWDMPFSSINECSEPPNHYSTMRFSVNDPSIVMSKSHDRNAVCSLNMTQKQTNDSDLALLSNDKVTSGINHRRGRALLTPTASQVSAYNMGMTSASTGSQIITERCHDSNMNNTNPVSIKEKSDWKESREHCSTAEWIDTSGEIGSSAYSMDERLWNDVNGLDTIMDWSVDNDICHHRAQHGQSMTIDTKPEVVASSTSDLVCDISSLSSDARYSHQEVDKDLIPGKLSLLDTQWAKSKWKFARCFDKMLPRENPSEAEAVSFYTILLKVYEFTSNTITDCLLDYYKKLCLKYNLSYTRANCGDMITQIQDAVMKSSAVYSDDYLRRCLLFMKYPFTHDFNWCRKAIRMVEEEYSIKVPIYPQNQNFVYSILVDTCVAVMNNKLKRVMLRQVGKVWYDKKQYKTKTVFGENAVLHWERKEVLLEGHIFRGYLVSVENLSSNSMTEEVIRNIQENSNSREEFCNKMCEMFWDSNGDLKMPHRAAHSTITTSTEQNGSPAVFPMHRQPRSTHEPFHQNFHHQPMLEKGNHPHYPSGSQPVQYLSQSNGYPGYCPKLPPIPDKSNEAQQLSLGQSSTYQTSADHQSTPGSVVVESHHPLNGYPNRIYTDKGGSVIEQQWTEEYQGWLTIRVDDRWESNCE